MSTGPVVRLSAALPEGERNGLLGEVAETFAKDTTGRQIVVALIEVQKVVNNIEKARQEVVLKIARVEAIVREDDVRAMKRIMLRASEERSGQTVLPFETEDEISAYFEQWAAEVPDGEAEAARFMGEDAPPPEEPPAKKRRRNLKSVEDEPEPPGDDG